jgi:hypothetical protein
MQLAFSFSDNAYLTPPRRIVVIAPEPFNYQTVLRGLCNRTNSFLLDNSDGSPFLSQSDVVVLAGPHCADIVADPATFPDHFALCRAVAASLEDRRYQSNQTFYVQPRDIALVSLSGNAQPQKADNLLYRNGLAFYLTRIRLTNPKKNPWLTRTVGENLLSILPHNIHFGLEGILRRLIANAQDELRIREGNKSIQNSKSLYESYIYAARAFESTSLSGQAKMMRRRARQLLSLIQSAEGAGQLCLPGFIFSNEPAELTRLPTFVVHNFTALVMQDDTRTELAIKDFIPNFVHCGSINSSWNGLREGVAEDRKRVPLVELVPRVEVDRLTHARDQLRFTLDTKIGHKFPCEVAKGQAGQKLTVLVSGPNVQPGLPPFETTPGNAILVPTTAPTSRRYLYDIAWLDERGKPFQRQCMIAN